MKFLIMEPESLGIAIWPNSELVQCGYLITTYFSGNKRMLISFKTQFLNILRGSLSRDFYTKLYQLIVILNQLQ